MATRQARQLRVAAVQMDCQAGQILLNLDHASRFVEGAAEQGAQLVLLPELMPSGYQLTEKIWDCAEPLNGPTACWLTALAKQLGIYLGTSFLEVEGEDFYNAFVLVTPGGEIAGRVRKSPPASLEAYFYRAGNNPHVIETALGQIGVGICYENLLFERLNELYEAGVDLVLQPTAAGRPRPFIPGDVKRFDDMIRRSAPHYARVLGVPVILANRTGQIHTKLPAGMPDFKSSFPGLSMIVDADGVIEANLGAEEGVVVANVQLDPKLKGREKPRRFGRQWAIKMPWYAFIWPLTQRKGERAYECSEKRTRRHDESQYHLNRSLTAPSSAVAFNCLTSWGKTAVLDRAGLIEHFDLPAFLFYRKFFPVNENPQFLVFLTFRNRDKLWL